MKKYKVTVTETYNSNVEVEANSPSEAEKLAQSQWEDERIMLTASDLTDITFKSKPDKPKEIEI